MEWQLLGLALCLGLASTAAADCATQCSKCALHEQDLEKFINPLICSLECQGSLLSSAEWEKCKQALTVFTPFLMEGEAKRLSQVDEEEKAEEEGELSPWELYSALVKRYGGFMKNQDKNKIFALLRENTHARGDISKKYGGFFRKIGERAASEMGAEEDDPAVLETGDLGYNGADSDTGSPKDEMKRYGGFLRKYPKRGSEVAAVEDDGQELEGLHKRYGGFMRRIRPKLKWDNQKRYGGFLRRQFKVTTRSEEEPSAYSDSAKNSY
ncbi:proenkephalin-B isoform X2 [Hemicordylus capensis]|uniref:proenkephalin-B isoform X2 n=1 Tax=Hemicordylus capensis TaxID=884348 RepID=UPI0023039CA6|nr:proenkephalin-B isoform X2 [Hemicordylus capensis]